MKQILKYITIAFVAVAFATSCHEKYVTYSDAEYVMFADTLSIYPVQDASKVYYQTQDSEVYGIGSFSVPVVSTVVKDYDRTFAVEIIDKGSTAIESYHYSLESNTVTIKAGENRADVVVIGNYDNLNVEEALVFNLRLVMNDSLEMPLYGRDTKVQLVKNHPFEIENFTGYCMLTSMFLYQYSITGSYQRLIKTEQHPTEHNTIICRNWFNDGYDVTMAFHPEDPLMPFVTMDEGQVASDEGSFFGQTHGDNKILVKTSANYDSIFYTGGSYLYVWTEIYVENLGVPVGTVGHYYNVMEWISDEEAERLMREEGM